MDPHSVHVMAEFHGCDRVTLNSLTAVEKMMRTAASAAGATVVESSFHKFGACGVSGVLVLAESHLSVHTWPETNYAATDIYTCGESCTPERAHEVLQVALGADRCEVMVVERGLTGPRGMRLVRHETVAASSGLIAVGQAAENGAQAAERTNRP